MVTYVGEKNFPAFAPLLPVGSFAQARRQNQRICGAIDEADGAACGVLILSATGAGCDIEYLYVARDYRLRGHGGALLDAAMGFAQKHRLPEVAVCYDPDTGEGLDMLLLKAGFFNLDAEAQTLTATLGRLSGSRYFAGGQAALPRGVLPLGQVPEAWVRAFVEKSQKQGGNKFFFDPAGLAGADADISMAAATRGGMSGAVWCSGGAEGFTIDGLFFVDKGAAARQLRPLVGAMLAAAGRRYPPHTPVQFAAAAPGAARVAHTLFPDVTFAVGRIASLVRPTSFAARAPAHAE